MALGELRDLHAVKFYSLFTKAIVKKCRVRKQDFSVAEVIYGLSHC